MCRCVRSRDSVMFLRQNRIGADSGGRHPLVGGRLGMPVSAGRLACVPLRSDGESLDHR